MASVVGRKSRPADPAPTGSYVRITEGKSGARLVVHVKPKASRNTVVGVREGALDVAVTAPPVDGAANRAVVELVARAMGVKTREVSVVIGATGRTKTLEIAGLAVDEAARRIEAALVLANPAR